MSGSKQLAKDVAQLGACVSDLMAHVHAFVTENETDKFLKQRLLEIQATTSTIDMLANRIAEARENDEP